MCVCTCLYVCVCMCRLAGEANVKCPPRLLFVLFELETGSLTEAEGHSSSKTSCQQAPEPSIVHCLYVPRYVLLHPVFSSSVRDSTSAPHALQQQIIYCRSHHPSLHISKISKQNQEMKTAIFGVRLSSNTQSSNTGVVYDSQVTSCTCKQRKAEGK